MAKGLKRTHQRKKSVDSIIYPLIDDEEPEKETPMISENTKQTPGKNTEKKKKKFSEINKLLEVNKERFSLST